MNVSLFIPCYIDQLYPKVAIATLELLERLGCNVKYPLGQTCCGQPMANSGFEVGAGKTTASFLNAFEGSELIVSPSGSCVHHLRDHSDLSLGNGSNLSDRIFELSEFLIKFIEPGKLSGSYPKKVGLHKSCHGLRGLRLGVSSELRKTGLDTTMEVLQRMQGIEVLLPERIDECCGFGGTFAVSEEAVSVSMGKDRIDGFNNLGVEEITATDMSCLMHLEGILKRGESTIRIKHLAEILNEGLS